MQASLRFAQLFWLNLSLLGLLSLVLAQTSLAQEEDEAWLRPPEQDSIFEENPQNQASTVLSQLELSRALANYAKLHQDWSELILGFESRLKTYQERLSRHDALAARLAIEDDAQASAALSRLKDELKARPTPCGSLLSEALNFIKKREPALRALTQSLIQLKSQEPERISKAIEELAKLQSPYAEQQRRAQNLLYICLHREDFGRTVQRHHHFERELKLFFTLQQTLVNTWLGNTD